MGKHDTHPDHDHVHGGSCGHTKLRHADHSDFVHDGHLHRTHDGHVDECTLTVGTENPAACTPSHGCAEHDPQHSHGAGCGHESVPHGDHHDWLVGTHLHHAHGGHCDDHGSVVVA